MDCAGLGALVAHLFAERARLKSELSYDQFRRIDETTADLKTVLMRRVKEHHPQKWAEALTFVKRLQHQNHSI